MPLLDEKQAIDRLIRINMRSLKRGSGPVHRGQHPKHHGCVAATFHVRDDIPATLSRGVFAKTRDYFALVRFSNGRVHDDRQADAHGMAIKVLDVPGRKLIQGREKERAQDFVLVDSETFFTGDPEDYELVNQATLGRGLLTRLFAWLRLLFRLRLLLRIRAFISKQPRSPLVSAYFSAVPYRLGDSFVKYVAMPRSAADGAEVTGPNGLALVLAASLAQNQAVFDFGVDVQVDPASQPIEDPTRCWSSAPGAKRVWLAQLIIPVQSVDASAALAENLAFSPWHALPDHEPVGYINRARAPIYGAMAKERHALNSVSPEESSEAPPSYGTGPSAGTGAVTR